MKHIFKFFPFILFLLFFNSCKDKNGATPTVIDKTEYFKCKLNNKEYIDDARFANYIQGRTKVVSQNNFELIRMDFEKDTIGTFNISENNLDNSIIYLDSNSVEYDAISGVITVTEFNKAQKILTGTFSGVLKSANNSTITVTEGKFNYIKVNPL